MISWTDSRLEQLKAARRHAAFMEKHRKRDRKLGPFCNCSLERRDEVLRIPMPYYSERIFNWWIRHGATWNGGSFEYDIKGKENQEEWINKASERFFKLWQNESSH